MASLMPPKPPTISSVLKGFIEDGPLSATLTSKSFSFFSHVKFVDFTDGKLRLLIASSCPLCTARHIRNVCNFNFIKECLEGIFTSRFPEVTTILPVLSTDEDFESVVASLGGTVSYPHKMHEIKTFQEQESIIMDQHPDIDARFKFLHWRDTDTPKRSIDPTEILSTQEFVRRYDVSWMIQESSTIVGTGGISIAGVNNILSNQGKFPPELTLTADYDTKSVTVTAHGIEFFQTAVYKEIHF